MQLWRMDSLGVTSEDFINRDSQNSPTAHYGALWRFANDRTGKAYGPNGGSQKPGPSTNETLTPQGMLSQSVQTDLAQAQRHRQRPLDNHLVDEARALGQPVADSDTGYTDEHQEAQAAGDATQAQNHAKIHGTEAKMTEAQLTQMSKDQLADIAAAVGVVNLDQPKKKLIDSILAKQG